MEIVVHQYSKNYVINNWAPPSPITSVGVDVGKKEPLVTVGGNANWYGHGGKHYGGSSKT